MKREENLVFLLGPTNTGKTHYAIEKMLTFSNGVIGLPLRLLAREVYNKVVSKVGKLKVALINGEEQITPLTAKYFVTTVESMPSERSFEFSETSSKRIWRSKSFSLWGYFKYKYIRS